MEALALAFVVDKLYPLTHSTCGIISGLWVGVWARLLAINSCFYLMEAMIIAVLGQS